MTRIKDLPIYFNIFQNVIESLLNELNKDQSLLRTNYYALMNVGGME